MKLSRSTLSVALLAALVAPAAHAEVALDVIGGSEVSFEGLVQADFYDFDTDTSTTAPTCRRPRRPGLPAGTAPRRTRAQGQGPGQLRWVLGYDAKDDKFLDANVKYKFGNNANHSSSRPVQAAGRDPGRAVVDQEQRLHRQVVDHQQPGYCAPRWHPVQLRRRQLGPDRQLLRPRAEPQREHGSGYALRGYWAPINETGNVLHFGASYLDKDTDGDFIRLRARPMADLVPTRFVDTGSTGLRASDRVANIGVEGLWIKGPSRCRPNT
jgi:phosphate-selective porin OprO/OprP